MDSSLIIALIIVALIFIFFIKPRRDKKAAATKEQEKKDNASDTSSKKLKRPDFTKEETLALGSVGLSFSIVHGKPEPDSEVIIIGELEDFTLADVKQLYQNLGKDQVRLANVLKHGCAFNPVRQQYAAGFLAKIIRARSDGDEPSLFEAWHKVVKNIIGLNITGKQGVECLDYFANVYDNEYEHGKGPKDDFFTIVTWLSQIQYN